ncbi:glucans biosynthesis glucosyltransferase MdoH [Sphingosinicellaceae bacterium]|nr:glucans biosynthesis glucosyltransferase MdoH [Sphingosinicellaceae bacterium]
MPLTRDALTTLAEFPERSGRARPSADRPPVGNVRPDPAASSTWTQGPGSFLPPEALLDMPAQPLDWASSPGQAGPAPLRGGAADIAGRRAFMVLGSLLLGIFGTLQMGGALAKDGVDVLDAVFLALFFSLFTWIAFGFLGAIAGVIALATRETGPDGRAPSRLPRQRTAVLLTICNEDLGAVQTRLTVMARSIASVGASQLFDIFVLSDSAALAEDAEAEAFQRVRSGTAVQIFYRRRIRNEARKPGNIADWVKRFGGAYESMIVLDADSLMTGEAMAGMAVMMEDQPDLGLLQTIPTIINGQTFFALWQQFAAAAYGHLASAGLQWWSGNEATFWGHNAIIRVRAFAQSCGLPALSGMEPFGGSIMSHDMVEATLLRRRGWAVQMVTLPSGSHEEFPPTLADHAVRDRRWCQGNLQHLRLLGVDGLHWVSRLQLLMGASSYITSPLWLLLLLVGLAEQARSPGGDVAVLAQPWLLGLTLLLLFGPKLIAWMWLVIDRDLRSSLGGGRRATATIALEIPLSTLVAPIIMLGQTMAIVDILRGRPSGWLTQRREADGLAPRDALSLYRWHIVLGLGFAIAALAGLAGAAWTMPVTISLLAAPMTAMLLSRRDVGAYLSDRGLFVSRPEASVNSPQRRRNTAVAAGCP